jgi:hypothetical protein
VAKAIQTKKKKTLPKENASKPAERTTQAPAAEEKPFNFGGLPARDLKKNLGCG